MSRVDLSGIVMGLIFIAIGSAFLLERLGIWTVDGRIIWPAILIGLGVSVLVRAATRPDRHKHSDSPETGQTA